jgi:hypothetical protein
VKDQIQPAHKKSRVMWVVVLVESGIPTLVEAYRTWKTASKREQILSTNINLDYDSVGVFEVKFKAHTPGRVKIKLSESELEWRL